MSLLSDERRRVLPDGSLLFAHVVHSKHNKPDEGTYQCVATIENLGSISSRTARLSVAGEPLGARADPQLRQQRSEQGRWRFSVFPSLAIFVNIRTETIAGIIRLASIRAMRAEVSVQCVSHGSAFLSSNDAQCGKCGLQRIYP